MSYRQTSRHCARKIVSRAVAIDDEQITRCIADATDYAGCELSFEDEGEMHIAIVDRIEESIQSAVADEFQAELEQRCEHDEEGDT